LDVWQFDIKISIYGSTLPFVQSNISVSTFFSANINSNSERYFHLCYY